MVKVAPPPGRFAAVIKPDSVIRAHIKTHLFEFVERHTFMHQGEVCVLNTWRGGGITPVKSRKYGRSAFYVHPETGLLQEITVLQFAADNQPLLGCSGHIHESPHQDNGKWIAHVGKTVWLQPGQIDFKLHFVTFEITGDFPINSIRHSIFGDFSS